MLKIVDRPFRNLNRNIFNNLKKKMDSMIVAEIFLGLVKNLNLLLNKSLARKTQSHTQDTLQLYS